jgi:hypothetical protein
MSWTRTLCACAALALASSGCANLLTSRAIDDFSESLAAGDTEQMREVSSERFARQALRLPEAGDDFKVLNLPQGKLTVLKTEDLSDDKKHITVQVGESDEKNETLEFHLTRPAGERRWVVDDVFVTQNKGGKGGPVTKSVTEQMDLLLTVREFLAAWSSGTREEVLAITDDELRESLADLPPAYLNQITKQTVENVNTHTLRPEAHIDDDTAVVSLSRTRGGLTVILTQTDDQWRVTDVAFDVKNGEPVPSVRIMAVTLQTAVKFLNAYSTNDRAGITAVSDPAFDRKLAGADLATVPLPVVGMLAAKYEYKHHGDSVDFVVPQGSSEYVVSLKKQIDDKPKGLGKLPTFLVSEVTLFEKGSNEIKRLTSLFSVHAVVEVFADALIARDRARLLALSTPEFNDRAWSPANDVVLQALPLPEIEAAPPRIVATVFQGPVTEVTVTHGSKALTYVLRSSRGGMLVDDVLLPVAGRSNSLKENVELLAPLYGFALGVHHHDMDLLKQTSGTGMSRMVWSHTPSVPDIGVRMSDTSCCRSGRSRRPTTVRWWSCPTARERRAPSSCAKDVGLSCRTCNSRPAKAPASGSKCCRPCASCLPSGIDLRAAQSRFRAGPSATSLPTAA